MMTNFEKFTSASIPSYERYSEKSNNDQFLRLEV